MQKRTPPFLSIGLFELSECNEDNRTKKSADNNNTSATQPPAKISTTTTTTTTTNLYLKNHEPGDILDETLVHLYEGLILLSTRLKTLDSLVASHVKGVSEAVAWAAKTLSTHSATVNMRTWIIINNLPPDIQLTISYKTHAKSLCVYVVYNRLLQARQNVRNMHSSAAITVNNTDNCENSTYTRAAATSASVHYSRLCDILTFFDNQDEMAKCVEAHRIVETGFDIIAKAAPDLFYRHVEPEHYNCKCAFISRWCSTTTATTTTTAATSSSSSSYH